MKEQFIQKRFNINSEFVIRNANDIIKEYAEKGFVLTLRQLYYQFVARDFIENNQKQYKRLGDIINEARQAGLIDWSAIEDRMRNLYSVQTYNDPVEVIHAAANGYAEALWEDQPYYCEVWVEKDALAGVVERTCTRLRVPFFACRGYTSQSEMYVAGKRLGRAAKHGKRVVIFHLGDHDPSGIDMTRDNQARLSLFARQTIEVRRLALNKDQIEQYDPPPNPAKISDSRTTQYMIDHGDEAWELDALDPTVLDTIIATNVEALIDREKMSAAWAHEEANRVNVRRIADNYEYALAAVR